MTSIAFLRRAAKDAVSILVNKINANCPPNVNSPTKMMRNRSIPDDGKQVSCPIKVMLRVMRNPMNPKPVQMLDQ